MLRHALLAFIPLFVAVDAIGTLPIFMAFTQGTATSGRRTIILQSMLTAGILTLLFVFLGRAIFGALGIEMGDFMIAGGVVLFSIALLDIVSGEKKLRRPVRDMGVVPLGTPLIAGPAVLTTTLISVGQYGLVPTIISAAVNIGLAGAIFTLGGTFHRLLGSAGSKALGKVTSLFLAAIAVMMIRRGILDLISRL